MIYALNFFSSPNSLFWLPLWSHNFYSLHPYIFFSSSHQLTLLASFPAIACLDFVLRCLFPLSSFSQVPWKLQSIVSSAACLLCFCTSQTVTSHSAMTLFLVHRKRRQRQTISSRSHLIPRSPPVWQPALHTFLSLEEVSLLSKAQLPSRLSRPPPSSLLSVGSFFFGLKHAQVSSI